MRVSPYQGIPAWITLLLLLLPCAAAAAPAATEAGAAPPDAPAVPDQTISQLLERIRELESSVGPYDPGLGEQLSGLGLAYQQNQDHANAAETLSRALHIKRVNEGLHNLGQLAILESLIASNIARQNWEDLDRNYQMLLWLHRRNFDPGDPRFLPIVDKMGRWKLQAYREGLLKQNPETTLREAESLYSQTVDLLEEQYGEHDPRLIDSLYGKAMTNYQIAKEVIKKPLDHFRSTGAPASFSTISYQQVCTPTPRGPVCRLIPVMTRSNNFDGYMAQQRDKDMMIFQTLQRVKLPLKQIVAIHEAHPELPRDNYAAALVHLGDWHLYYDQRGTAFKMYKQAYEVLAAAGKEPAELERLFGKPVTVPSLRLDLPDVEQKLDQEREFLNVSFDVTRSGRARNIRFDEDAAGEDGARRRIKKLLSESKFRPRLVDGEPVDTEGVTLRIPVPA